MHGAFEQESTSPCQFPSQQQLGTRSAPAMALPMMLNQAIPSQFGCTSSTHHTQRLFPAQAAFIYPQSGTITAQQGLGLMPQNNHQQCLQPRLAAASCDQRSKKAGDEAPEGRGKAHGGRGRLRRQRKMGTLKAGEAAPEERSKASGGQVSVRSQGGEAAPEERGKAPGGQVSVRSQGVEAPEGRGTAPGGRVSLRSKAPQAPRGRDKARSKEPGGRVSVRSKARSKARGAKREAKRLVGSHRPQPSEKYTRYTVVS